MLAEARQHISDIQKAQAADTAMEVDHDPLDHRLYLTNMRAPYVEGSGDPCLSHGTIPDVDPAIKQAPVPADVQVAQDVARQMDAYDKHARMTQDYYKKALKRHQDSRACLEPVQQGSRPQSETSRDPRRKPTG